MKENHPYHLKKKTEKHLRLELKNLKSKIIEKIRQSIRIQMILCNFNYRLYKKK